MNNILKTKLIKLNIGLYTFNPAILPTVVALFFIYLMLTLAQWQSDKADYKINLEQKIIERKDLPAISLDEMPESIDDRMYMPVIAYGKYDDTKYFLLDNKILNGKVGYDIYTPLQLADASVILVNRGFLPQGRTRNDLPVVATPTNSVSVRGLLDKVPSKTVVLADNVNQLNKWPVVLQYLDTDEIKDMLGQPVSDMIIRLNEKEDYGFARVLPALNLNSAKNTGYAFQWYAMTLALIIIYFVVNTNKRDKL